MTLQIGILTVSDRASAGEMEDRGGPAVAAALAGLDAAVAQQDVVPDDVDAITRTIQRWADKDHVDVIFTTGGTGLGPRDVTPEATLAVAQRLVPGIPEALRAAGLTQTPQSILSRGVAAVRGTTLIVNLPGSPRGAAEGVEVLKPVLEHAVSTLHGGKH